MAKVSTVSGSEKWGNLLVREWEVEQIVPASEGFVVLHLSDGGQRVVDVERLRGLSTDCVKEVV